MLVPCCPPVPRALDCAGRCSRTMQPSVQGTPETLRVETIPTAVTHCGVGDGRQGEGWPRAVVSWGPRVRTPVQRRCKALAGLLGKSVCLSSQCAFAHTT
eukprot:bmy_14303T0